MSKRRRRQRRADRRAKRKQKRKERGGSRFGVFLKKTGGFIKNHAGVLGGLAATALTGGAAAPLALKGISGKGILSKAKGLFKKSSKGANSPIGGLLKDVVGGKTKIEELLGGIDLSPKNPRNLSLGFPANNHSISYDPPASGNTPDKDPKDTGKILTKLGIGLTLFKLFT